MKSNIGFYQKFHRIIQQNNDFKKRSLDGYNLADFIAIPADHARQSFIERWISKEEINTKSLWC